MKCSARRSLLVAADPGRDAAAELGDGHAAEPGTEERGVAQASEVSQTSKPVCIPMRIRLRHLARAVQAECPPWLPPRQSQGWESATPAGQSPPS